jgi:hypothetical protein
MSDSNEYLNNDGPPSEPVTPRRVLPIPQALQSLYPGTRWTLQGLDYDGLDWQDSTIPKPSKEVVEAKAEEILAGAPLRELRRQRDNRMKETDWVTLRSFRTGEPISQEWQDYMQALADITDTATPSFSNGQLVGVEWPTRPDGKPAGPYRGGGL